MTGTVSLNQQANIDVLLENVRTGLDRVEPADLDRELVAGKAQPFTWTSFRRTH